MTRKKQTYLKGHFTHRHTETDYMGVLLDAVPLDAWREIVTATVTAAKAGDPSARAWLGHYLVGKPAASAPAPLTVIVQQLSGNNPLVDRLAKPHIERAKYPSFGSDDDLRDAINARVADELRYLEAQNSDASETGVTTDGTTLLADSPGS